MNTHLVKSNSTDLEKVPLKRLKGIKLKNNPNDYSVAYDRSLKVITLFVVIEKRLSIEINENCTSAQNLRYTG